MAASDSNSSSTTTPAAAPAPPKTDRDVEAQSERPWKVSHLRLVLDQAGVDSRVLDYAYPGDGTEDSPYVVDFLPGDPRNPMLLPVWRKWTYTMVASISTMAVSFASSAYSGCLVDIIASFHVSEEVALLGISLFVLGFALGPLLWAPLSEFYGRQHLFVLTYTAFVAFNAGAAGSQNIQTLVVLRFFAGAFGSSPLTNSGGIIADVFPARDRGLALALYSSAVILGPVVGPIVGGFLGETEGWRWVEGVMAIFSGVLWVVGSLVPETYAPVLLRRRAAALTARTGRRYVSKLDLQNKKTVASQFKMALLVPWILLFKEPIVLLLSLYIAIVYGTLYLMFASFPIVFQEVRGWSPGIGGLAFLGLAVGMGLSILYAVFVENRIYVKESQKHRGPAPPEVRLPSAILASVLLPIGLFWFAWTSGPSVHWVVPLIGSAVFGAGMVLIFLSVLNYLIDSYVVFAASALAANSVIRSLFSTAFPLFTTYMYRNLGVHWAGSIPAFLALACTPFPYLFWRYGKTIRAKCQFAAMAAEILQKMLAAAAAVPQGPAAAEAEKEQDNKDDPAVVDGEVNESNPAKAGREETM